MGWFYDIFSNLYTYGILYFAIAIMGSYIILAIYSGIEMASYLKKNKYIDYRSILVAPSSPAITIIAPAYNEASTIVENVRSLLSLHYGNFEVIIVNDGSKDNSLEKLINSYDLHKVDFAVNEQIPTKKVRGVYKSTNPAFKKLVVVDKENGGKADALNVGVNVSVNPLITCIDVDCIIEQDALLKMVKPYLEETDKVIATGGVIRIANSCVIEDGRIMKVKLPDEWLPRFQVLEYIRAFLMGRMAWSKLNGLLLVSGALGLFDKNIVIKCGGYDHGTVGEDMELVVRMRRYMHERDLNYKVVYIPDPLCWTEAPADGNILGRQRNRWTRGTAETLWIHRAMFFNPRYGLLGILSMPYWFFFEWLAPIIELVGMLYCVLLILIGGINWHVFVILLVLVYVFAIMLATVAILFEEMSYRQYTARGDMLKLFVVALLEPFVHHPRIVYWAILGNIDLITGKKNWGEMTRQGFGKKTT